MVNIKKFYKFLMENKLKIVCFIMIGTLTAIAYLSLFNILWLQFKINYYLSLTIAYFVSIIFHYFSNKNFTFKNKTKEPFSQLSKYTITIFVNYLMTVGITSLTINLLHLPPNIAIVAAAGITLIFNYLVFQHWVFKTTPEVPLGVK